MNRALLPPALQTLRPEELLVSELFHSIQGESTHAGRPCFFVRLAGCHLRCSWCDTAYAFHGGQVLSVDDCLARVEEAGCKLVEVTGGEPLLQSSVNLLMGRLCDRGYEVLLETSGAITLDRVDPRVCRIVDWKCPGSGMVEHNREGMLRELRPGDELKLVINDRTDYEWARAWLAEEAGTIPAAVPVHFSPVCGRLPFEELAGWILEDGLPVRLNLQIHKWIWGPDASGV